MTCKTWPDVRRTKHAKRHLIDSEVYLQSWTFISENMVNAVLILAGFTEKYNDLYLHKLWRFYNQNLLPLIIQNSSYHSWLNTSALLQKFTYLLVEQSRNCLAVLRGSQSFLFGQYFDALPINKHSFTTIGNPVLPYTDQFTRLIMM
jgi:hypothetical protein